MTTPTLCREDSAQARRKGEEYRYPSLTGPTARVRPSSAFAGAMPTHLIEASRVREGRWSLAKSKVLLTRIDRLALKREDAQGPLVHSS